VANTSGLPDEDPDLVDLLIHADRAELDSYLPTARRFLEAAGDEDWEDVPIGLAIVESIYVITGAAHTVGGKNDRMFWAGLGFVLAPENMRTVVRFWRKVAELDHAVLDRMLSAARDRREPEGRKE